MPLFLPPDIEANAEQIVQRVGSESVAVYRFLDRSYKERDPQINSVFQFVFRSFYRLDNAGLTDEFKSRYFEILSQAKSASSTSLGEVVRSLFELPNRKGQPSLQFSFATKLVATVDSSLPIYDAEVAAIFGFRAPYNYRPFEQRLQEYQRFYYELQKLFQSIIQNGELKSSRALFRKTYQCTEVEVSESKVIDFLFWSAGKLSREAAQ